MPVPHCRAPSFARSPCGSRDKAKTTFPLRDVRGLALQEALRIPFAQPMRERIGLAESRFGEGIDVDAEGARQAGTRARGITATKGESSRDVENLAG
jgi:hypothetical protein